MSDLLKKMDKIMYDGNICISYKIETLQYYINNLDNYYYEIINSSHLSENEKKKFKNQVSRAYPQLRYILLQLK